MGPKSTRDGRLVTGTVDQQSTVERLRRATYMYSVLRPRNIHQLTVIYEKNPSSLAATQELVQKHLLINYRQITVYLSFSSQVGSEQHRFGLVASTVRKPMLFQS